MDARVGSIKRPWTVSLVAVLLVGQWAGFWGLAAFHAFKIRAELAGDGLLVERLLAINIPGALRGLAFGALGLLALLSALGFWRVWPVAWLSAVSVQGLSLALALGLHFRDRPFYIYLIMLSGIWIVIYLNFSEVLEAFDAERMVTDWEGSNER